MSCKRAIAPGGIVVLVSPGALGEERKRGVQCPMGILFYCVGDGFLGTAFAESPGKMKSKNAVVIKFRFYSVLKLISSSKGGNLNIM